VGLIHRDIKPGNIFAAQRGGLCDVAKLLDFGLVKETAQDSVELTRPNEVAGSPAYMSPEQATRSTSPDERSDIYSLGATAYFLLTGRAPFTGDSFVQVLIAHVHEPVEPPSKWCGGIPRDVEAVILRCLQKLPTQRFQSAAELHKALAECQCARQWTDERAALWWARLRAEEASQALALDGGTLIDGELRDQRQVVGGPA
jgi:serine/threonine-protein kinase